MATWMAHLRIADRLLDLFYETEPAEFIMGNIAPDSGIPCDDKYIPDKKISHYLIKDADGHGTYGWWLFAEKYLSNEKIKTYDKKQYSFYLGYLTHLMADIQWVEIIGNPLKQRDIDNYKKDKNSTVWKWKKDWYDIDHRFIRDNPDFRAFSIYKQINGFKNFYLDFFPENAFDERHSFIADFYTHFSNDLDREYIWLTESEMNYYILKAEKFIIEKTVEIRNNFQILIK